MVAILALTIAFAPTVVAPLLSARLSDRAGVAVHVGWISWNPLAASATFHDVTVAPSSEEPAIVTIGAVHLDVALRRWLADERVFDRVVIERPWVGLQRTASGDFNLSALFRSSAPAKAEPVPSPAPEAAPERTIHIDAFRLVGGSIRFRDETTAPVLETSLHLDDAVARDLSLAGSGRAEVRVKIESHLEKAPLTIDVTYRAGGADSDLEARLSVRDASLSRTLLHVPVGWQRVTGTLGVDVAYRRRIAGGQVRAHAITGKAELADVSIGEPWTEEPSIRAAHVQLNEIGVDLMARRTDVGTVRVERFTALVARAEDGIHVPLTGQERSAPPSQWRTSLRAVELGRGTITVRGILPGDETDVPVAVTRGRITFPGDDVELSMLTDFADGTVELSGRAAETTRLVFTLRGLAFAEIARRVRLPIRFAKGRVDGAIVAAIDASGASYSGNVTVADAMSVSPNTARPEDVMAWKELTLALGKSTVAPLHLHVTRLDVAWPYLMAHRAPDGIFPIAVLSAPAAAFAAAADATPAASADRERRVDDRASTRDTSEWLRIDTGAIRGGRVEIYDTTLQPPFGADLAELEGSFEGMTASPLRVPRIALSGSVDELSPIRVSGSIDGRDAALGVSVERLRLAPLSRYLEPGLNHEVTTGLARVDARIGIDDAKLDSEANVVLSRLALRRTGPDPVAREIGVSLPVALSLMKDLRGDVRLTVPVQGDLASSEYRLGMLVGKAIGDALVGAVSTPIRLLGSIFRRDEEPSFDLKPVPFAPASGELGPEGDARIAQVARLLERHPELHAVLIPAPSAADVVRLRDDTLIEALERSTRTPADDGVLAFVRARVAGASPVPLSSEVRARLREIERATPVSTERLTEITAARTAAVVRHLTETDRIDRGRVRHEEWEPTDDLPEGIPGVDVQLRGD